MYFYYESGCVRGDVKALVPAFRLFFCVKFYIDHGRLPPVIFLSETIILNRTKLNSFYNKEDKK